MIDRTVHHAEVLTLKGPSRHLKNTGITTLPSARTENTAEQTPPVDYFSTSKTGLHFTERRRLLQIVQVGARACVAGTRSSEAQGAHLSTRVFG
jgi:hypothetical protein